METTDVRSPEVRRATAICPGGLGNARRTRPRTLLRRGPIMTVTNPLPTSLLLLNLALPGVWFAGRALARKVVDDPSVRLALAPGLAMALLLIFVHVPA